MNRTEIAWTDRSWNPVRGCSRVSEGCRNCYAERMAARFSKPGMWGHGFARWRGRELHLEDGRVIHGSAAWTSRVELVPEKLDEPLRLRKPQRIFVNSTSDLFHEALPFTSIAAVYGVMARAPQHTFQVLTKRPDRRIAFAEWYKRTAYSGTLPLSNVWEGVSVEDQATADKRTSLLLQTPAAVRFVSYEPALGPVDFHFRCVLHPKRCDEHQDFHDRHPLDWVIVGGESGPGARPFSLEWARSVRQQCLDAGVAFFFKQGGTSYRCAHSAKGGCFECIPEDLRVREMPK